MSSSELGHLFPTNAYEEAVLRLDAIDEVNQYDAPDAGVLGEGSGTPKPKLARQDQYHPDGSYLGVGMAYTGGVKDAISLQIEHIDPEDGTTYVKKYTATQAGEVYARPEASERKGYARLSDEAAHEIHRIVSNTVVLSLHDPSNESLSA